MGFNLGFKRLIATDISYENLNAFHYWMISILFRYEDHISEVSDRK